MNDVRCEKCSKLLLKADYLGIEVKCPRCKLINKFNKEFINQNALERLIKRDAYETRCKPCTRRLPRVFTVFA